MILILDPAITPEQKALLRSALFSQGCIVREFAEQGQSMLGAIGGHGRDDAFFKSLPGVVKTIPISTAFKLVSRQLHPDNSVVAVGTVTIGAEQAMAVAGPCAIESREQALTIARRVKQYGASLFRGGAFKPRTSPYSFQGLGEEGLKILAEVRETVGLPVVTEMTSTIQADMMMKYVDAVQIGARNMQNFELLKCVGRMGKPVVLKRGLSSTIEEWLMSAEYILSEGNNNVILCERGIRTFEPYTRNTLDLSAIPVLKKLTHLPVLVDPSHATGIRAKVSPMARAAIAAGADGVMVEVHHQPEKALSDGAQSLYPKQFGQLMRDLYVIAPVVDKQIAFCSSPLRGDKHVTVSPDRNADDAQRVAFAGGVGAFSHKACLQYFGAAIQPLSLPSYRRVFEAVRQKEAAFGIVPLENSLTGSIHENYDLLIEDGVHIVGELTLRIMYHLVCRPDTSAGDLKRVLAPPRTLRQCRVFLEANPHLVKMPVNDTVEAVDRVSRGVEPGEAAIANKAAAAQFGLKIVEEGVETNPRNFTRYVVVGRAPIPDGPRRKSSLTFATGNRPGALLDVLRVLADSQVNMVKLESRPILGKPWEYMFYVDLEADVQRPSFKKIMRQLRDKTEQLKVLGVY